MGPLPIQYLHLETGIFLLFLAMVLWTQLQRASERGYYTQAGRIQVVGLMAIFAALVLFFGSFLYRVSPLLAVELAAGFTLSLLHPANALCFFAHMLFLRPWEIATDNMVLLALPRLLGLLWFVSWLIHPTRHTRPGARALRLLAVILAFSFWLFLSTFKPPVTMNSQSDWFNNFFKSIIVLTMCLFCLESDLSVSEFENTIVISALGLMAVGLSKFLTSGDPSSRLESVGLFGDPNDLASVVVMAIPFPLVAAFRNGIPMLRLAWGLSFAAAATVIIWFTRSRGAMLALIVEVLTNRFDRTPRGKRLTLLLLAAVLGAGYMAAMKAVPRDTAEMGASSESRIIYWKAAVNMAVHFPVFGVGYGKYPLFYDSYSWGRKYEFGLHTAHSSWLLALAESGFFGGSLFAGFYLSIVAMAWRNRRRRPGQLYSVAGYGLAMTFLSHTYMMYPYIISGLVMASDSIKEPPLGAD